MIIKNKKSYQTVGFPNKNIGFQLFRSKVNTLDMLKPK